jgi:hypothetical protein
VAGAWSSSASTSRSSASSCSAAAACRAATTTTCPSSSPARIPRGRLHPRRRLRHVLYMFIKSLRAARRPPRTPGARRASSGRPRRRRPAQLRTAAGHHARALRLHLRTDVDSREDDDRRIWGKGENSHEQGRRAPPKSHERRPDAHDDHGHHGPAFLAAPLRHARTAVRRGPSWGCGPSWSQEILFFSGLFVRLRHLPQLVPESFVEARTTTSTRQMGGVNTVVLLFSSFTAPSRCARRRPASLDERRAPTSGW